MSVQDVLRRYFGPFEVTTPYGGRAATTGAVHRGVDIAAPLGTPLRSPVRGRVDRVYTEPEGGLVLDVGLPSGGDMLFAHLAEVGVRIGEEVTPGELLGRTGASGRVTGPHLHYEVRSKNDDPSSAVDPLAFLERLTADACPPGQVRDPRTGECGYIGRGGFIPAGSEPSRHPGLAGTERSGSGGALPPGSGPIMSAGGRGAADVGRFFTGLGQELSGALAGLVVGAIVVLVIIAIALMGVSRVASSD